MLALSVAALALALVLRPDGSRTLVAQARRQVEAGRTDLALSYLNEALRREPRNLEALNLKTELLERSARSADDLLSAIKLGELSLRLAPDGPQSQALRRRLVALHLKVAPLLPEPGPRYNLADDLARQLIEKGARDADAYRLRARVQEGLAQSTRRDEPLDRAIQLYEKARQLDPAELTVAERLAVLYRDEKNAPKQGRQVLDDLLAAVPESARADAQLVRSRYLAELAHQAEARGDRDAAADLDQQADTAIEQAVTLAPDRPDVRLLAADYYLRRDRPEVARQHLRSLPEDARDDPRAAPGGALPLPAEPARRGHRGLATRSRALQRHR